MARVRLAALVRAPELRDLPDAHVRGLARGRSLRRGGRRSAAGRRLVSAGAGRRVGAGLARRALRVASRSSARSLRAGASRAPARASALPRRPPHEAQDRRSWPWSSSGWPPPAGSIAARRRWPARRARSACRREARRRDAPTLQAAGVHKCVGAAARATSTARVPRARARSRPRRHDDGDVVPEAGAGAARSRRRCSAGPSSSPWIPRSATACATRRSRTRRTGDDQLRDFQPGDEPALRAVFESADPRARRGATTRSCQVDAWAPRDSRPRRLGRAHAGAWRPSSRGVDGRHRRLRATLQPAAPSTTSTCAAEAGGQGVGGALMRRILARAEELALAELSLAREPHRPAVLRALRLRGRRAPRVRPCAASRCATRDAHGVGLRSPRSRPATPSPPGSAAGCSAARRRPPGRCLPRARPASTPWRAAG